MTEMKMLFWTLPKPNIPALNFISSTHSFLPAGKRLLLAAFFALGFPLAGQTKDASIRVDVELVLAVDISFSMDPEEQRFQRTGYVRALTSAEFLGALKNGIHGKIAITYFQWANNNDTNILLPWTIIDGPASAKAAADKLAEAPFRRARRTSISGAIEKAVSLLKINKYKGLRQVIDISGDGTNNDGEPVNVARDAAIKKGIIINGLPLMIRPANWGFSDISNLDEYFDDCVTGGPGSFVIPIKDRKHFIRAIRTKLVLEIAAPVPGIIPAMDPMYRDVIYVQRGQKGRVWIAKSERKCGANAGADRLNSIWNISGRTASCRAPMWLLCVSLFVCAVAMSAPVSAQSNKPAAVNKPTAGTKTEAGINPVERSKPSVSKRTGPPIFSGAARIHPVVARNGMVVAQESRAARIGLQILRRGGNAVDAAVATAFALAVTLPRAGNIGGGGFMLVHLAKQKKTIAIDYRETAPAAMKAGSFLDAQGNFVRAKSQASGLAAGVPGTVAGMALAHKKYGSGQFTLAQLIAPAVALAREGFLVDEDLARSLRWAARRMRKFPASRAIFFNRHGQPLKVGARLVQTDLAASLGRIAEGGAKGFYTGLTAQKIVAAVRATGGSMTLVDMAGYQVKIRKPVRGTFRGREILSMPPPSSGGIHIVQILNILEPYPLARMGHNSARLIHLMTEAMKRAYADRSKYLGDPDFVSVPARGLMSKAYAQALRKSILPAQATPAAQIKPDNPLPFESIQTTHFSVVDKGGNAVANTYTLNFSYGLALVAAGTGIVLNNELDDFAAKPDVPNAYGLLGGAANAPGPRKRPLSSMSPAMVFKEGKLEIVTGSPGGSRIITTVLQIILNIVEHGMNAAEATIAPRIHHQWFPDFLSIERGISADTIRLLEQMGHRVRKRRAMGSTQTIHRKNGLLFGASDTRRRGATAAGY